MNEVDGVGSMTELTTADLLETPVESIAGITFEEACLIGARNGIRSSNRDIAALALFTLAEVFRDALVPVAAGADEVSSPAWDILHSAVDGITSKMVERLTGDRNQPHGFKNLIGPEAAAMLVDSARSIATRRTGGKDEHHLLQELLTLGQTIETALEESAPVYVDLNQLDMDDAINFRLRLNTATYRLAEAGEVLPSVSIGEQTASFTSPAPVPEGAPVATFCGQEFSAPEGEFLNLMNVLDRGEFRGLIRPNYLLKPIVFEQAAGGLRRVEEDCWFVRLGTTTILVPPLMAMHIMRSNLEQN